MGNRHHVFQALLPMPEVPERGTRGGQKEKEANMEVTNEERREAVERLGRLLDDGQYRCTPERVYGAALGMAWGVADYAGETCNVRKLMAMIAPQLPDGVVWPRFEDGELVPNSVEWPRFERGDRIKRPAVGQHCKYCQGGAKIDDGIELPYGVELGVTDGVLVVNMEDDVFDEPIVIRSKVPIKYCPMCGRRVDG